MKIPESSLKNILFVQGGAYPDVKKALRQWIDSYADQLEPDAVFKIYKNGHGKHVIQADESLDNMLFYFLVNYINYPEGIEYKVKVEGFTKGTNISKLIGKKLLVVLPDIDTEYDNVLLVTEDNQCYKMDFGGKLTGSSEVRLYREYSFENLGTPEILKVKLKREKKEQNEGYEKIDTRFKWITASIIVAHLLNLLILGPFSVGGDFSFEDVLGFLFIATSLWFYMDYKMLRDLRGYLKCMVLAIGGLIYWYLISLINPMNSHKNLGNLLVFTPLVLLSLQWPLRMLYILLLKREPIVDRRPEKFVDMIYSMILLLGSMFLSFGLGSLINGAN